MPIYMDVHIVPGVKAKNVAEAHRLDMAHQDEYNCKCMTYWIDEERENIFCLIEAPDKDAVKEMHRKAHGLIPHKIIEVSSKVVKSFLGRIFDPEEAETTDDGLKVFHNSSFRIVLVTKTTDPFLLEHQLGREKANELLQRLKGAVRKTLVKFGGTEVEYGGSGFIISFTAASAAVSCALSIIAHLNPEETDFMNLRIAVNAGDPVENSNKLFGDVLQQAQNMCTIGCNFRVIIASYVKDLISTDYFHNRNDLLALSPQDEMLLRLLFDKLEENCQNSDFDIEDYCKVMGMSQSQLYRRTIELTGLSPNQLLKAYRLARAKELIKQKRYSISQITFDSGFTSPSYFTKCFKKMYGLLPMNYLNLLD